MLFTFTSHVYYRSWQELGYLIIYISGRPDVQKDSILSFLGSHDFPLGLVVCADSLSTDSQSLKTAYLGRLIKQVRHIQETYLAKKWPHCNGNPPSN